MSSEKDIKSTCSKFSLSVVAAILASVSGLASCVDLHAGGQSVNELVYVGPQAVLLLDQIRDLFVGSKDSQAEGQYRLIVGDPSSFQEKDADTLPGKVEQSTLFSVTNPVVFQGVDQQDQVSSQGLICSFTSSNLDSPRDGESFLGIAFVGDSSKAGITLTDVKASLSGAALYSTEDLIFEKIKGGLEFASCSSLEQGGACAAQSILIHDCQGLQVKHCTTAVNAEGSSANDHLGFGGGAFFVTGSLSGEKSLYMPAGDMVVANCDGAISFEGNSANFANGGAIAASGKVLFVANDKKTSFIENRALSGGAIAASSDIAFQNCAELVFKGNCAIGTEDKGSLGGGAISSLGTVLLQGNHGITCDKNESASQGGAIFGKNCQISDNEGPVVFRDSTACLGGGAIAAQEIVSIQNNQAGISFEGGKASFGGGIACGSFSSAGGASVLGTIDISKNLGAISFSRTLCTTSDLGQMEYQGGGALFGENISLSENAGVLTFKDNIVKTFASNGKILGGGAILATGKVEITNNSEGISFTGNARAPQALPTQEEFPLFSKKEGRPLSSGYSGGGAILGREVAILHNAAVVFEQNRLQCSEEEATLLGCCGGGAVHGMDSTSIVGNSSVRFGNNYAMGQGVSGGALLSKTVQLAGNGSVDFSRNIASLGGGALQASEGNCELVDNGYVLFRDNRGRVYGGAISCLRGDVVISGNKGRVEFKDNIATRLYVEETVEKVEEVEPAPEQKDNNELSFLGSAEQSFITAANQALFASEDGDLSPESSISSEELVKRRECAGGAIFAKRVRIVDNQEAVVFSNNFSDIYGGAIFTGSLREEDKLDGQIPEVLISGNAGDVVFSGNSSKRDEHLPHTGGGAICTQNLTISQNTGNVLFYNNVACSGGAVRIEDHGNVLLEAFGGDIVFKGNSSFRAQGSDAIYFAGKESHITALNATEGHAIVFHDALVFENLEERKSAEVLLINSRENPGYTGSIRFLEAESKVPQCIHVQQGSLELLNGATLCSYGFKQDAGAKLVLAAGAKLKILDSGTPVQQGHAISKPEAEIESSSEPEGAHSLWIAKNAQTTVPMVDIHTISVDLASFSSSQQEGTVEAPQVIVPGGSYVRSGELNLELVNTTGTGYENHALLKNEAKVPLMSFVASGDEASAEISNLSVSDLQIHVVTPEIEEDTYGHMGDWSEAKIQDGTLVISWNPTGYRLDPQKAGALVFNALWEEGAVLSTLKNARFAHNLTAQRMEFDYSTNVWGFAFGGFRTLSAENLVAIDGYKGAYGGASAGVDIQLMEDFVLGVSGAAFLGKMDSQKFDAEVSRKGVVGSVYTGFLAGSWFFKGQYSLGETQNDMKTRYGVLGESSASWTSRGVLADALVEYRSLVGPVRPTFYALHFNPYVEVSYASMKFPGFTEQGREARSFEDASLTNITIPLGMKFELAFIKGQFSEVNSLGISYAWEAYRKVEGGAVQLLEAGFDWEGAPMDLPRQELRVALENNTEWSSYFSTVLGLTAFCGGFTSTDSKLGYEANTGLRLIF